MLVTFSLERFQTIGVKLKNFKIRAGLRMKLEKFQFQNYRKFRSLICILDSIKIILLFRNDDSKWKPCSYYDLDYKSLAKQQNFEMAFNKVNYTSTETKSCTKWVYDTSIYQETTVSQVN